MVYDPSQPPDPNQHQPTEPQGSGFGATPTPASPPSGSSGPGTYGGGTLVDRGNPTGIGATPQQPQGINPRTDLRQPGSGTPMWLPQGQLGGPPQGATWQPQAAPQYGGTQLPAPAAYRPAGPSPGQSLMQMALAGGSGDPQQVQNMIAALNAVGAGGNNAAMAAGPRAPAAAPRALIGGVPQSNGSAGSAQYANGFGGNQNFASYNYGLGAQGGQVTGGGYGQAPPPQQQGQAPQYQGSMWNPGQFHAGGFSASASPASPGIRLDAPSTGEISQGLSGSMPNPRAWDPSQVRTGGFSAPSQGVATVPSAGSYGAHGGAAPYGGMSAPQPTYPPFQSPYASMLMSDERTKTDVRDDPKELHDFLDELDAHDYRYKDEKHGKGRHTSPMAQELAASKIGRRHVVPTSEGLAIDYGPRMMGTVLASVALNHQRLKKLERRAGR